MFRLTVSNLGTGATVKRAERSTKALINELLTYLLTSLLVVILLFCPFVVESVLVCSQTMSANTARQTRIGLSACVQSGMFSHTRSQERVEHTILDHQRLDPC